MPRKSRSAPAQAAPHSWSVENWPAHVYPHTAGRARYTIRSNRRALREAHHTDSPYKDSYLDVTPARLRRGQSTQPLPAGSDELRYKNGTAPNVRGPGFLGLRRKKKR